MVKSGVARWGSDDVWMVRRPSEVTLVLTINVMLVTGHVMCFLFPEHQRQLVSANKKATFYVKYIAFIALWHLVHLSFFQLFSRLFRSGTFACLILLMHSNFVDWVIFLAVLSHGECFIFKWCPFLCDIQMVRVLWLFYFENWPDARSVLCSAYFKWSGVERQFWDTF